MKKYLLVYLIIISLFLIIFSFKKTVASGSAKRVNLLVITVDTLRADHVGIYGGQVETPIMDRLGKQGVIFTHAYSHVPLTLPSHCSLFTGMIPPVHGVRDNGYRLPDKIKTLAEIFKDRGYATAAFVGAFPLDSRFGLDRGFDVYDDNYGSRHPQRDLTFIERKAEEVNAKALGWLEKNKENNFFVWIHYFDPHAPYEPPSPFKEKYARREYDGEIAYTDQMIGYLLTKIEEWKLIDKTVIILTSDHGESLGEHEEKTHGIFIYDATLHVPLIFFSPKLLPCGRRINEVVGLSDIFPTALDLFNIPFKSNNIYGKSLKNSILKGKGEEDREIYIESIAATIDRNWAPLFGLRTKNWKFIEAPMPELYDVNEDPRELNNLYAQKPQIARQMEQKLKKLMDKNLLLSLREIKSRQIDREVQEKLRSLGYIAGSGLSSSGPWADPKIMIEIDNLFNEAIISSEEGRTEEACYLYEMVLKKQPHFAAAYEYASYNYYKMGRLSEAIALLERALASGLETKTIKARLGLYLQEEGKIKESIELLRSALKQDPFYTEAYNYLGVSYFKAGELDLAIEAFKKALALDKDYAMAMNNLGNVYLAQQKYNEAIEQYLKAIEVDPRLGSAYNGMGVSQYKQGKIKEAIEQWKMALEVDSLHSEAAYNLGLTLLRLGQKEEALKYLELFLAIAPAIKYSQDREEIQKLVEKIRKEIKKSFQEISSTNFSRPNPEA